MRDRYHRGTSIWHQTDARVKLVLTLAYIIAVTGTPPGTWGGYVLWTAWAGLGTVLAAQPLLRVWRQSLIVVPFTLAALTLVFRPTGRPLATLNLGVTTATLYSQGVVAFISIVWRSWLSTWAVILLLRTTRVETLWAALAALRLPPALVHIFRLTYRYLFVIRDEAERMMRARAARSPRPVAGSPWQRRRWLIEATGDMVGVLFLRSVERSTRVYQAMLSRGYRGHLIAEPLPPLSRRDLLTGGVGLMATLLLAWGIRLL